MKYDDLLKLIVGEGKEVIHTTTPPSSAAQPEPMPEPLPEPVPEAEPVLSHMWEQPDKCPFCLYFQPVRGQCYWRGMCSLDGKPASIGQKCRQVINF